MESNLIFAYGSGFTLPDCDDFITKIKARDGKPVHWYEFEVLMAMQKADPDDVRHCLGILEWVKPEILQCPLSGPLVFLTQRPEIIECIYPYTSPHRAISFFSLRKTVWEYTKGELWLDLQLRWELTTFIGRVFPLDRYMRSPHLIT